MARAQRTRSGKTLRTATPVRQRFSRITLLTLFRLRSVTPKLAHLQPISSLSDQIESLKAAYLALLSPFDIVSVSLVTVHTSLPELCAFRPTGIDTVDANDNNNEISNNNHK